MIQWIFLIFLEKKTDIDIFLIWIDLFTLPLDPTVDLS